MDVNIEKKIIIFGAGPAGLATAMEAVKKNHKIFILEKEDQVGGIAKTVKYKGYHFDIGGHRFFTKEKEVQDLWHNTLGKEFLVRPRLSRIYYKNKFYFYPLKPFNALKNIGPISACSIIISYFFTRAKYYIGRTFGYTKKAETFDEWITQRFGAKLFNIFFKTYTEKVWGIPTTEIGAEWAAQRIKSLSLTKAVINAFFPKSKKAKATSLIDQFNYPRYGPGMMYESMANIIKEKGGEIIKKANVTQIRRDGNHITGIVYKDEHGNKKDMLGTHYISTIPLPELIKKLEPKVSDDLLKSIEFLQFRAFIAVCLIIDRADLFPDNWIYIHSPEVEVGRIQNFKNWNPDMVPDHAKTSLGMEYFCFEGDKLWKTPDKELIGLASKELEKIGLGKVSEVIDGFVIRQKDTYPIYRIGYKDQLQKIYDYIKTFDNLQIIGRGGTFRYNNMDHSIISGIYAARNIMGEHYDVLSINIDEAYQEIKKYEDT